MSKQKKSLITQKTKVVKTMCNDAPAELKEAVIDVGMTPDAVAKMLLELCHWETVRFDKNGEAHHSVDGALRYKALELWNKVMGTSSNASKNIHNHLHLEKITDDELDRLEIEANKVRKTKKKS